MADWEKVYSADEDLSEPIFLISRKKRTALEKRRAASEAFYYGYKKDLKSNYHKFDPDEIWERTEDTVQRVGIIKVPKIDGSEDKQVDETRVVVLSICLLALTILVYRLTGSTIDLSQLAALSVAFSAYLFGSLFKQSPFRASFLFKKSEKVQKPEYLEKFVLKNDRRFTEIEKFNLVAGPLFEMRLTALQTAVSTEIKNQVTYAQTIKDLIGKLESGAIVIPTMGFSSKPKDVKDLYVIC